MFSYILRVKIRPREFIDRNIFFIYSVLFNFGHIRRWDQCAIYIL